MRLRSWSALIVERFQPELRLTPMQDVLLYGLDSAALSLRWSVSWMNTASRHRKRCPTCSLYSMSLPGDSDVWPRGCFESDALPGIIDELEVVLPVGIGERGTRRHATGCRTAGPAVSERCRHRRAQRRQIYAVRRRPRPRPPAELRAARPDAAGRDRLDAATVAGTFQARTPAGRVVRRLLQSGAANEKGRFDSGAVGEPASEPASEPENTG